jgi:hypothetical protein
VEWRDGCRPSRVRAKRVEKVPGGLCIVHIDEMRDSVVAVFLRLDLAGGIESVEHDTHGEAATDLSSRRAGASLRPCMVLGIQVGRGGAKRRTGRA